MDTNMIDLTESDDEGDVAMTSGAGEPDFSRLAFDEATLAEGTSEELLKLLNKEEIVTLGKKMKVPAGKGSVSRGLARSSSQQLKLDAFAASRLHEGPPQDLEPSHALVLHLVVQGQGEGDWRKAGLRRAQL